MTRQEAIRHLHTYSTTMGSGQTSDEQHNEAKRMAIEALSADAVQRWIPCSERLPKTGDDILVTFSDGEVDIIISARPKSWVKYEEANNLIFPVAWMPLPKPYRKDGEDDGED